jgi:hypothetical protein
MSGPFVLEREMGCTRADFMRWLGAATGNAPARAEGDALTFVVDGGEVRVSLREEPPRRIAGLALPVLRVRFSFVGLGRAARDGFMARFDDYTRRGGG